MNFLTPNDVITLHEVMINRFGGSLGIRDENGLDATLNRPKNIFAYEADSYPAQVVLTKMAAAILSGLIESHPFIDGNKRVAFTSCIAFLRSNGVDFHPSEDEFYDITVGLATRRTTEDEAIIWISKNMSVH